MLFTDSRHSFGYEESWEFDWLGSQNVRSAQLTKLRDDIDIREATKQTDAYLLTSYLNIFSLLPCFAICLSIYTLSAETTKDSSVLHRGTCQQEEACRWQHLISMFWPYEELPLPLKPCPCTRNHSALYALVALDIACHTYVWGKIDVRWFPRCACYQCRCIYSHVWKCLTNRPALVSPSFTFGCLSIL